MVYTPPKYPGAIPTLEDLPNRQDDVDWLAAARYNELKKELRAALTELGTDPAGAYATVKARLDALGVPLYIELNILLNAFRIAINGSLVKHNMVDGIMDEFEDESGVDTEISEHEDYDVDGDYYGNEKEAEHYSADLCTEGTPSEDSFWGPEWKADKVFDDILTTYWVSESGVAMPHWVKYDFGEGNAKVIERYRLYYYDDFGKEPKDFKFQGSNNDVDWDDLDAQTGQTWSGTPAWKTYDFSNSTAYRYYRILITANGEASVLAKLYEMEMMEYIPAVIYDMTLVSESTEAETQPDAARIVLMEEDVDVVTVNTDLKTYASRDNGANWVQATLTDEGDYGSGKRILTGAANVSGQAADKTIKWKVTTHNSKELKLHGVGLLWG